MGLTLAERRAVTETIATRYALADKPGRQVLDELCANTGGTATMPARRSSRRCSPRS